MMPAFMRSEGPAMCGSRAAATTVLEMAWSRGGAWTSSVVRSQVRRFRPT